MNLNEWFSIKKESAALKFKESLAEDYDNATCNILTEEEQELCREEFMIESYAEVVEDFEELDMTAVSVCEDTQINEIYDFMPSEMGSVMDLEFEFDMEVCEQLQFDTLVRLKEMLNAESYDIEELPEAQKAKVVFNRSKGNITKKKVCGKGMKLKGNKCIPQTGTQKAKERKKGIVLKRAKRAMGSGAKKKAAIQSRITKKRTSGRSRNFSQTVN